MASSSAVPWHCDKWLIGDALLVHNIHVEDIMSGKTSKPHTLTPGARVTDLQITYPGSEISEVE